MPEQAADDDVLGNGSFSSTLNADEDRSVAIALPDVPVAVWFVAEDGGVTHG